MVMTYSNGWNNGASCICVRRKRTNERRCGEYLAVKSSENMAINPADAEEYFEQLKEEGRYSERCILKSTMTTIKTYHQ